MWQERIEPISNDAIRQGMAQARVERARAVRAAAAWLWCKGRDLADAAIHRRRRARIARGTRRTLQRLDTRLQRDIGIQRHDDIERIARQLATDPRIRRDCRGVAARARPDGVSEATAG